LVSVLSACGEADTSTSSSLAQPPTQTPYIIVVTNTAAPISATPIPTPTTPPTTATILPTTDVTIDPAHAVVLTADAKDAGKPPTPTAKPVNDASPLAAYLRTCGGVYSVTVAQAYADSFEQGFKNQMPYKYTINWYSYDPPNGAADSYKVITCITTFTNSNNLNLTFAKDNSGMPLIPTALLKGSIGYQISTFNGVQAAVAMGQSGKDLIAIVAIYHKLN
jgi:hypothetical protein